MDELKERIRAIIACGALEPDVAAGVIVALAEAALARQLGTLREQARDRKRRQRERSREMGVTSHGTVTGQVTGQTPSPSPPSLPPPITPPITPPVSPPSFSSPLPRRAKGVETYSSHFLLFWEHYPLKVGKGDAWNAWRKCQPSVSEVIRSLAWQRNSPKWQEDGGKFIPHPSTYINQRRWEDEPPARAGPMYQKPAPSDPVCRYHETRTGPAPESYGWCRKCRNPGNGGGGGGEPSGVAEIVKQLIFKGEP